MTQPGMHLIQLETLQLLFARGLYQFQAMILLSSIYLTVALAVQRYLAISKPIEYHNDTVAINVIGK